MTTHLTCTKGLSEEAHMKSLLLLLAYGLAIGCCEEGKDTTAIEQSTTVNVQNVYFLLIFIT